MGEIEVSKRTGEELVARGLGSCIGLALIDQRSGVAGMAHIVLPESAGSGQEPGKFADSAVPELISRMQQAGAVPRRLDAVLAGGARMFELGEMDIGARNAAAVKAGLVRSGVKIRAAETGGNRGRTLRLTVGEFEVTVKEAGGQQVTLFDAGAVAPASRTTPTTRTATAPAPPRRIAVARPATSTASARSAARS